MLATAVLAAPASADVVYDNSPAASGAEVPSLSFVATGTAELGALVELTGAARRDPRIRVPVVVGPCDTPSEQGECPAAGSAFTLAATIGVYAVGPDRAPGPVLARRAESFELAAADSLQPLEFSLPGVTLPAEAIVSIAIGPSPSAEPVGVALAGPPAAGANLREAEGVYRAKTFEGAIGPLAFEATGAWQGRQPAFTIEASSGLPVAAAPAATASVPRTIRREIPIPPSRRMSLGFPRRTARIAGPGALVEVTCAGSSAARCIGTLSLSAAGAVHKTAFSISKGRKQYIVVPLGDDLDRLDGLRAPHATATASTVQLGGAAVRTKRALRLK